MSNHANLTRQIQLCLNELQHTGVRRQQIQSALLRQLQTPVVLLGGFCLGLFLQSAAGNKAALIRMPAQLPLWLWTLWRGWPPAAPAVSMPSEQH